MNMKDLHKILQEIQLVSVYQHHCLPKPWLYMNILFALLFMFSENINKQASYSSMHQGLQVTLKIVLLIKIFTYINRKKFPRIKFPQKNFGEKRFGRILRIQDKISDYFTNSKIKKCDEKSHLKNIRLNIREIKQKPRSFMITQQIL